MRRSQPLSQSRRTWWAIRRPNSSNQPAIAIRTTVRLPFPLRWSLPWGGWHFTFSSASATGLVSGTGNSTTW